MTEIVFHISLTELCQYEGFTENLIVQAVDYGIAQPVAGNDVADWVFDTASVYWLQKAVRLYYDFEIDWIAVAMLIDLLQENEALLKQNDCFEQQLKRFSD